MNLLVVVVYQGSPFLRSDVPVNSFEATSVVDPELAIASVLSVIANPQIASSVITGVVVTMVDPLSWLRLHDQAVKEPFAFVLSRSQVPPRAHSPVAVLKYF